MSREQKSAQPHGRIDLGFCVIDYIDETNLMTALRGQAPSQGHGYVVTPNIDHVQRLYSLAKKNALVEIYRNAKFSVCDSRILQRLMSISGHAAPPVVTGSGLTARLFEELLTPQDRVVIIGGSEPVIEKVRAKYPALQIQHRNPSMGFIHKPREVDELVSFCREAAGDFIFLAVGSPQQELLAARFGEALPGGISLCVGASLNFIVGEETRAPRWMQKISCEWLYRLLQNPRRLARRYARNLLHMLPILRCLRRTRIGAQQEKLG